MTISCDRKGRTSPFPGKRKLEHERQESEEFKKEKCVSKREKQINNTSTGIISCEDRTTGH